MVGSDCICTCAGLDCLQWLIVWVIMLWLLKPGKKKATTLGIWAKAFAWDVTRRKRVSVLDCHLWRIMSWFDWWISFLSSILHLFHHIFRIKFQLQELEKLKQAKHTINTQRVQYRVCYVLMIFCLLRAVQCSCIFHIGSKTAREDRNVSSKVLCVW